jgi:transposase
VEITGANVHDSTMLDTMLDAIPPLGNGKRGRPRSRPEKLHADKGYDYPRCRESCRQRNIKHRIARRGMESKNKLGRHRWVIERTLSWLSRKRRLVIRYERLSETHLALLHLGCSLICLSYL